MTHLRAFALHHRRLAAALLAMALLLRALIPVGIMVDTGPRVVSVKLCSDSLGLAPSAKVALPSSGKSQHGDDGQAGSACHFTVLGHASLGSADPALLALALLFIIALGFLPLAAVPRARLVHVLPPQCGPPALV